MTFQYSTCLLNLENIIRHKWNAQADVWQINDVEWGQGWVLCKRQKEGTKE